MMFIGGHLNEKDPNVLVTPELLTAKTVSGITRAHEPGDSGFSRQWRSCENKQPDG